MLHYTCFKCRRINELDPVLVGIELGQLKTKSPKFYQATCPACRSTTKVPVAPMKEDIEAVADEVATKLEEVKAAKAVAKAAKKAAREAKA